LLHFDNKYRIFLFSDNHALACIAGMNLLVAIIIFWNTTKLGEVVTTQKRERKLLSPNLLAHVSLLAMGAHQPHRRISVAKALA